MTLPTLFAAAVLTALLAATTVMAGERMGDFVVYGEASDVIGLDGEIDAGTVADFHRALAARPHARVVVLQSPGGYVDEALRLAAEIRRLGLSTAIPKGAGCYSACTYLFFAGKEHVVRGSLGVHRVASDTARDGSGVYDGDVRAALSRYGASAGVIKAMVSTPPSSLHVFSPKEITAMSINRAGGGSLAAKYAAM